MQTFCLTILFVFIAISNAYFNPIPIGSLIISSASKISYFRPRELGGSDDSMTIYTAPNGTRILSSIFNSNQGSLYVIYRDLSTNPKVFLSQLVGRDQLSSTLYRVPIFLNDSIRISADVEHNRAFAIDPDGKVQLFSMSGLLAIDVNLSTSINDPIRSIAFNTKLNRLFVVTDSNLYSCLNFDLSEQIDCCKAVPTFTALRSIAFDRATIDSEVYVLDKNTGVYRFLLDSSGCPRFSSPISSVENRVFRQLVVDQNYYFYSAGAEGSEDNSYLVIQQLNQEKRLWSFGSQILALHLSPKSRAVSSDVEETCFHGITYTDYRTAVVLAALFGTIMGIFMCFNALFCIDFMMTKRIIKNLKKQIPHDLLEDRWNKLVEEKYAKIALEKMRKKDDPPPPAPATRRPTTTNEPTAVVTTTETRLGIPKISEYLRRKSESYLNRRRSDEYRAHYNQEVNTTFIAAPSRAQVHIETVEEENENRSLKPNLSRRELLKNDGDFF